MLTEGGTCWNTYGKQGCWSHKSRRFPAQIQATGPLNSLLLHAAFCIPLATPCVCGHRAHDRRNRFWGINGGFDKGNSHCTLTPPLGWSLQVPVSRQSLSCPSLFDRKEDWWKGARSHISLHFGMSLFSLIHQVVMFILLFSILSFLFLIVTFTEGHTLPTQTPPVLKWNSKSWGKGRSSFSRAHA